MAARVVAQDLEARCGEGIDHVPIAITTRSKPVAPNELVADPGHLEVKLDVVESCAPLHTARRVSTAMLRARRRSRGAP